MPGESNRVAALDLGTNTFLCLVVEMDKTGQLKVINDTSEVVRLGQGVQATKRFHPDALQRAKGCLAHYAELAKDRGCSRIIAAATSAARDVSNADELRQICADLNIELHILSGDQEAEMAFSGTGTDQYQDCAIVDVGGGSTEIMLGVGSKLLARQSFDLGSVRLTEMFVKTNPISTSERSSIDSYISETLSQTSRLAIGTKPRVVIGIAGTPNTLATFSLGLPSESDAVESKAVSIAETRLLVDRLFALSSEERSRTPGIHPKRADVLPAGALIFLKTLELLNATEFIVSTRGLRYGLAARALKGEL